MNSNYKPREIKIDDFYKIIGEREKIKFLLNFAVLAPSTHNTQPWLFKIEQFKCKIYYNSHLLLPEADVKKRDLFISMGCAVENLILAAKYFNVFDNIDYDHLESNEHIATINFRRFSIQKDKSYQKLIESILSRRNARGIFGKEVVPEHLLANIFSVVGDYLTDGISINLVSAKDQIGELALLTAEGLKIAYKRSSFRKEMSHWMTNNFTKRKEGIPGYALKMPFLLSFIIPGLVRWVDIGPFLAKKNYQSLNSAPLIAIITAESENSLIWLKIGRLAERLFLELNSAGWQTSIFVAAIEMGFSSEVKKIINTIKEPQFLFAVGRIDSLHQLTPRHPASDKII